jgi:predicted RND superfamily exporter protein
MSKKTETDEAVARYGQWLIHYRWPVIVGVLVMVLLAASGGRFLSFASDYRVFFSEDNPQLQAFDELQNVYTKNDNVLFVVEPADGDPFSNQSLAVLSDLADESWKLPYAIRVDAVTNFQHTEADGDDLVVADLVETPELLTDTDRAEVRRIALQEPMLSRRLVSDNGDIAGVNVTIQLPGESIDEVPTAADAARELASQIEAEYPGTNIYVTGIVIINSTFVEAGMGDLTTVFPLMYLIIIVVMIVLLRSLWGTIATLTLVGMSAAGAMGMAGWFGVQLTPTSSQAPTMIMTLAVADSIHLLITMLQEMRRGKSRYDAIIESLRVNFIPVFLTSVTTAIGFLSLNFSDSPPYRHLGNITAVGVSLAFVLSVVFLPAVLSMLPIRVRVKKEREWNVFGKLADWVVGRQRLILGASLAVILFAAVLAPGNKLNDDFVKYFDTSMTFRTDTDFANANLTGLTTVEHSISSGEEGGISEPAYLAKLDSLAEWYEAQPGVVHVNHLGHVLKRLNMNMHGDDSAYYRLPDDRELAAQYLLLFEMSLPYGLDLNNMISVDKSSTRFTVTCTDISSSELIHLAKGGEQWLASHAPPSMQAHAASPSLMFSYLSRRQVMSMLTGTIVALALITLAMMFALRSVRYGLLSVIPNLVPMIIGLGAWALLVGEIGLAHSTIVGMTLGIVVDDTVHFLNKYLRARRELGMLPPEAVRYALSTVGRALLVTSIVLVAGFLVLTASPFKLNSSLGQLSALTIAAALIADFLLLPVLLLLVDRPRVIALKRSDNIKTDIAPAYVTNNQE